MPELVALLYRADWKQLSLSARITWQYDQEVGRQLQLRNETSWERRTRAAFSFAELGVILRQTSFTGGRPAILSELRNLTPQDSSDRPADFGPDIAAGVRVVNDPGGLFPDRNLPAPARAAATAVTVAAAGAIAVTGWLDKHRAARRTGTHP
jgi:hypothetical protein